MGAEVGVQFAGAPDESTLARVTSAWSRSLAPESDDPAEVTVSLDAADPQAALAQLSRDVTMALLRRRTGECVLLHAVACAEPATGRAVVLAAPSGTGKTTLTRHLAQRWGYLSDETAAIEFDLTVHPHPKPLSIIVEPGRPKVETGPDELGLVATPETAVLAALGVLERVEDHRGVSAEWLGVVDGILALHRETSGMALTERPLRALAELFDQVGTPRRWRYAEAGALSEELLERAFETPPPVEAWTAMVETAAGSPAAGEVGWAEIIDWVEADDRRLVMLGDGSLLELSPLATAAVDGARVPASVDALAAHCVEVFGAPEGTDARGLVQELVDDLVERGVLTVG